MSRPSRALGTWWNRATERYVRFTVPAASGLPNWRVVAWFPLLATLGTIVLILLSISGTSSGMHWYLLGSGEDPRLIAGSPRGIRSDEWLVQQAWVISQYNTGFGAINPTFPGGSDVVLLNELPSWDWSSVFRPHLWGYLLFGLDTGISWHWWVPALTLVSGTYLFMVSMLPRRPLTAATFAVGIYFTPILQWFYTPSAVYPVAWALLALAGVIWILRDPRTWVRVVWSAVIGYVAVTMAMGLYVPFMLPGLFIVVAFSLGYVFRVRPWVDGGAIGFVRRLTPLAVAAVAAGGIVVVWIATRWPAVDAILSTVYPGERAVPTGAILAGDPLLMGFAGAPWSRALLTGGTFILGANSSEAASVILLAIFLLPALAWIAIRSFRRGETRDWLVVASVAILLVILAYLFVPGWDGLAHVLQLDRVPPERFRIAFAVLLPVFAALVIDHVDNAAREGRARRLGILSAGVTLVILGVLTAVIVVKDPAVLGAAGGWYVTVPALVVAVLLLFDRRRVVVGAALLAIVAVVMTVQVNPVYRGALDISRTDIGQEIMRIDAEHDGEWVGIGSYEPRALLTSTGVGSYTGVQNYPSEEMWDEIDPDGEYEAVWNRLAHVTWVPGPGEPVVTEVAGDLIEVTFDACSRFAQDNVDYVLTDGGALRSDCLTELVDMRQGQLDMRIYQVVSAS